MTGGYPAMQHELFHWDTVLVSFLTVVGLAITTSPIWLQTRWRMREMQGELNSIKKEHADCAKEREEYELLLRQSIPSDPIFIAEVVEKLKQVGLPVTMRDVCIVVVNRQREDERRSEERRRNRHG